MPLTALRYTVYQTILILISWHVDNQELQIVLSRPILRYVPVLSLTDSSPRKSTLTSCGAVFDPELVGEVKWLTVSLLGQGTNID